MSNITLRLVKGSPLTNQEVDDNFANLNTDKYEAGDSASFQDVTLDSMSGPITWNVDDGTLDVPLNASVTLQMGQEFVFYAKATEAISNGDVVMFAGAQGGHLLISKCDMGATGFDPTHVVGIATQSFAANDFGYVTSLGKVRDLDTTAYAEGTILYVDPTTAGGYTTTKPSPPNHIIQIAAVVRSHGTQGTLLVRTTHMPDTDEIPEGSTNLYFTDARATAAIKADADWNATNWDTAYGWGNHANSGYLTSHQDISGKADLSGATFTGANEIVKDGDSLLLRSTSASAEVGMRFTSQGASATQFGHIRYNHSNAASYGAGEVFTIGGTEASTVILADGQFYYKDGIYKKPASGTGVGTRKDANWDTAYSWGNHASAGYLTSLPSHTHDYLPLSGGTITGNLTLNSATPQILFNGTSDAGVDMAIRATPEGLDFYEPEDSNKIHFQILDDTGVNSPFGYKVGGVRKDLNWDTAYSWGNHASAGYLTSLPSHNHDDRYFTEGEADARYVNVTGDTMTGSLEVNKTDAYLQVHYSSNSRGGIAALSGQRVATYTTTSGDDLVFGYSTSPVSSANFVQRMKIDNGTGNVTIAGTLSASGYNKSNWDTAYGWGDHSTQNYATQTYVNNAVSNLVDSAPSTLDTLNELAAALGDDANFSTTVTNSIGTKVSKSGDTMTGDLLVQDDIKSTGQIRATGWWNTNTGTSGHDLATEIGVSGGISHILSYNRASSSYGNLNISAANVDFPQGNVSIGGATAWHSANDGSGSGLDADLLDGQHGSYYATASHSHDYVPERNRTDWNDSTVFYDVVGQLGWRNYGNNHTIFDASSSLTPSDTSCNNTNAAVPWSATYPTLMGWNGSSTYGVRVDSARVADSAGNAGTLDGLDSTSYMRYTGWNNQDANSQGLMKSNFTYSNNAPFTGELIRFHANYYSLQLNAVYNNTGNGLAFRTYNNDSVKTWNPWRKVWHDGNDGSGSGLDADLLDGQHASAFAPASHSHNYVTEGGTSFNGEYPVAVRTGTRTMYSDNNIRFRGSDSRLSVDGSITTPTINTNSIDTINMETDSLVVGTDMFNNMLLFGNEVISAASTSKTYVNHELTSGMGIPAPTGGQVLSYDSASDSVLWIDPPAGGGASNSVYGIDYWNNAPYTGAASLYLIFDTEAEANALWDAVKASSGPGQLRVRARYEMFQYGSTGFDLTMDPYYSNPTFWSLMGNLGPLGNQWVLGMDVYITSTPTDGSILLGEGTWELT